MTEVIAIFCTGRSSEELSKLAQQLVKEKLIACANIIGHISSHFYWKGKACHEQEALMIAKSSKDMFEKVCGRIRELHPYELPEILALPVIAGLPEYLDWVLKETHARSG